MKRLRRILCQFLLIWIYVILLVGVFSKESAATTLYWTEGAWGSGELKRAQIGNLGSAETIASSSASFSTLAVDHRGGKVYWTGDSLLHRANLDGSNREGLSSGFGFSEGIAIDLSSNRVYWTGWDGNIRRSSLNGDNEEIVFAGQQRLFGLSLDAAAQKMYWTAGDTGIYRGNVDGTGVEFLVDGGTEPLGITIDLIRGKIYWADWEGRSLRRANLDGTNAEIIYTTTQGNPIGVTVDLPGEKIYWTEWGTNYICRANLDGTSVEELAVANRVPWGIGTVIPEPSSIWLLALGISTLTFLGRKH